MNDRLMIAAMALQGMVVNNYWEEVHFSAAATDAFRMADALLATAGEQGSKPGHWHAVAMRQVDEIEALTARAEAAEAKVAALEAKLAAAARLARDSAEAAGEMVGSKRSANDRAVERIKAFIDGRPRTAYKDYGNGMLDTMNEVERIIDEEASLDQ